MGNKIFKLFPILKKLDKNFQNEEKNNHQFINNMKEEDIINLCLKMIIVGSGDKKKYVEDNIFKDSAIDEDLKEKFKINRQFKTERFNWIAHVYEDGKIDDNLCKEIENEIKNDKKNNENKILNNEIIICFENENTEKLSHNFQNFRKNNMIFITKTKCEISEKMDKRYAINIIYGDIDKDEDKNEMLNDLKIQLISILWEFDCYYKEKGNTICRYTPENIFKSLEKDNSHFTINILLTGFYRAGKSTFINLVSRKLIALESNLSYSVTKNISEYYIYRDDNDDNNEHAAIKLIDTPGIVNGKTDNEYKEKENQIIGLIKGEEKTFEKRIHFIFFLLMNGSINLKGENILEVFKALNESKCHVFFLVNKVKKTADFSGIIKPIQQFLNQNGLKNISKEENFIAANFLKGTAGEIYGIDTLFSKIFAYIKNNLLEDKLKIEMEELIKDFRSKVESNKAFLPLEKDNILKMKELKENIQFRERMDKIKKMTKNNELFSNFDVESSIINGRNSAYLTKDIILSLFNFNNILPAVSQDLPIESIYQAFMVKEIGEGYGLDINILNSGTKYLLKHIKNVSSLKEKNPFEKSENQIIEQTDDLKNINDINIDEFKDIIKKKSSERLEFLAQNNKTVYNIADILNSLNGENKNNNENCSDQKAELFNGIFAYCLFFFEKEIKESEGLNIMFNYLNKIKSLLKDIESYYTKEEYWKHFEMQIKKLEYNK